MIILICNTGHAFEILCNRHVHNEKLGCKNDLSISYQMVLKWKKIIFKWYMYNDVQWWKRENSFKRLSRCKDKFVYDFMRLFVLDKSFKIQHKWMFINKHYLKKYLKHHKNRRRKNNTPPPPTKHNMKTWCQDWISNTFCHFTDEQINQNNWNKYRVLVPNWGFFLWISYI